ncbi:protein CIP2A homolog L-like [Lineus longissimus]|uniref:protein CIP2A homolog L-like n=1 Tax=Lineus longissimus TaxID=88925 RepID=UPI002B4F7FA4
MDILTYIRSSSQMVERGKLKDFLDGLVSLTSDPRNLQPFLTKDMDVAQCLSLLVDILSEPKPNIDVAHRALCLLENIAKDEAICQILHNTYGLSTTLTVFLLNCGGNTDELTATIAKCLEVMRKVTYNTRVSQQNSQIPDLLKFLMKRIMEPENDVTQPALGLMANLCRHSVSVQAYVKSAEKANVFLKCIIKNLSCEKNYIKMCSFHIWCSLNVDEAGGKLFNNDKNTNQSFQMLFHGVIDSGNARAYAVDLLTDLVKKTFIQKALANYSNLEMSLRKLFKLLPKVQNADKLFELLLSFCSTNSLRCVVCRSLFDSPALQDSIMYQQMMEENNLSEPFFAVVHWARQSVETHNKAPLLALDLLRELYEVAIDSGETTKLMPQSELVLPTVTEILMSPLSLTGPAMKQECQRIVKAVQLLKVLCLDASLQTQVAESIDTKTCVQLIKYQIDNNRIGDIVTRKTTDVYDWCDAGVDVVLHVVDLALKLKDLVPNMKTKLQDILLGGQISPFLAYGMTSENRERVQLVLHLLASSIYHAEFPATLLGDNISTFNGKLRQREGLEMNLSMSHRGSLHQMNRENVLCHTTPKKSWSLRQDQDVDALIAKMNSGMDMKSNTSSDMIDIYAHKIRALETQERHQKDLLDAKTMALAQADRLISNYRCQSAKHEAEAHRLKSLILQSDKNSEVCREQMNEVLLHRNQLSERLEKEIIENKRLLAIVEEHDQLLGQFSTQQAAHNELSAEYQTLLSAHDEKCAKLENTEKQLSNLKSQYQYMQELNEQLQKSVKEIMKKTDEKNAELLDLEEKHRKVLKSHELEVNENTSTIDKLTKSKQLLEEKLKQSKQEEAGLQSEVKKLVKSKEKLEKSKESLQDKIYKLEEKLKMLEGRFQAKEKQLRDQQIEIEKHSKIAAMIHNLSSGKVPPNLDITS